MLEDWPWWRGHNPPPTDTVALTKASGLGPWSVSCWETEARPGPAPGLLPQNRHHGPVSLHFW